MKHLVAAALAVATAGCSYVKEKAAQVDAISSVMQPGHSYRTYATPSDAMAPTIRKNSVVVADESAYVGASPQRGDVVVFYPPTAASDPFVKRVVAVPGDTFDLRDGRLAINHRLFKEPYLFERTAYQMAVRDYGIYVNFGAGWQRLGLAEANLPPRLAWSSSDRVPRGCYIVLGDNRNDSEDSHIWGFAQRSGSFATGPVAGHRAQPFAKIVKTLPQTN